MGWLTWFGVVFVPRPVNCTPNGFHCPMFIVSAAAMIGADTPSRFDRLTISAQISLYIGSIA